MDGLADTILRPGHHGIAVHRYRPPDVIVLPAASGGDFGHLIHIVPAADCCRATLLRFQGKLR